MHPLGLPDLATDQPAELPRVLSANSLYQVVVDAIRVLDTNGTAWSIENPRNSLMWHIPGFLVLAADIHTQFVYFPHCAYGGDRPKWTAWLHRPATLFKALAATCPGESHSHRHAPWGASESGTFATALETVYPDELCESVVAGVRAFFAVPPLRPLPVLRCRGESVQLPARPHRLAADRQPRGSAARALLPEFEKTLSVVAAFPPADPRLRPGYTWAATTIGEVSIPKGAKTVRTVFPGASGADNAVDPPPPLPTRGCLKHIKVLCDNDTYIGRASSGPGRKFLSASKWANPFRLADCPDRATCLERYSAHLHSSTSLVKSLDVLYGRRLVCHCLPHQSCHADIIIQAVAALHLPEQELDVTVTVGIYADMPSFAASALQLRHPFEWHSSSASIVNSLLYRMSTSNVEVASLRARALDHWRQRADQLAGKEAELHAMMDRRVAKVMAGKNILVLVEMLHSIGFPTAGDVGHYLSTGFPVTGPFPPTGIFPLRSKEAEFSVTDLWSMAADIRQRVIGACGPSGDAVLDRKLFDITTEEVQKGWLEGPLEPEALKQLGCWIPSRRFAVVQGSKVRPIDDYTISQVNGAFSAEECIDPADVDAIAANAKAHADALVMPESARSSSSPFSGVPRHADRQHDRLLGRMWDIASAYKNLAVRPSQAELAIVVVWDPAASCARLYRQLALPFGASASVLSFNWVGVSICSILTEIFRVGATAFYDDYTVLEASGLCESTTATVEGFFSLIGWPLKELPGFAPVFSPLGARFDLEQASQGVIVVGNKPERVEEMCSEIHQLQLDDDISAKKLEKLRGRLLFQRSLCFGRFGGMALRLLTLALMASFTSASRTVPRQLLPELRAALRTLSDAVRFTPARSIKVVLHLPHVCFTDGAFEDELGMRIGGVLFDRVGRRVLYFGVRLSAAVEAHLLKSSVNPITAVELAAAFFAVILWQKVLKDQAFIIFVDNDAAKHSVVRAYSKVEDVAELAAAIADAEIKARSLGYWERVPSASNVADPPSRGSPPPPVAGWPLPLACDCTGVAAHWGHVGLPAQILRGWRGPQHAPVAP